MEAQTDIQTYLEQGKQALAQGQGREAALAYAHAAQIEPDNPMVHLGLAEANLAMGNYGVVQMACKRVQELQSHGVEETIARALMDLLDRRYDRALQHADAVISEDPGIAYVHALRAYLLRATGHDYDANLARARSARLAYGGRFDNCFPPLASGYGAGYSTVSQPSAERETAGNGSQSTPVEREPVPTWSRPNGMQRQVIRTRFALSRYPGLVTYILIAINLIVYILMLVLDPLTNNSVIDYGAQINVLVMQGEYWRIFTAMFLHDPTDIFHIILNMLSLFFIGRAVEVFFGKWRYLVIYLIAGICAGITFLVLSPGSSAVGASGAIFGVFGALGVFYIVNRRALGAYGSGAIGNWLFWLALNLFFGFVPGSNIAVWSHIGGLIAGMILAFILMPRARRGRSVL